jgi:hypothetical protein
MTDQASTTRFAGQRKNLKKYGILFFDSIPAALAGRDAILTLCATADQVNVVIRAEGVAQEGLVLAIHAKVKVFCGNAWWIIHERRKADAWYDTEQE